MTDEEYFFLPASLDDVEQLCLLENQLFHTDICSRRSFRYLIVRTTVIVVKRRDDARIYGYATLLTRKNSSKMRIYSIGVSEQARLRGIGSQLLELIEKLALMKDCTTLTLEVSDQNIAALALYEKTGFHQYGFVFEYYEDGGHAIRMRKKIGRPANHYDHPLHESCLYQ